MEQQLFIYVAAIVLGGVISLSLGFYSLFRLLNAPGGRYYMISAFLASSFNFAYLFELTSSSLSGIKFWLKVEYLFLPLIPPVILLMCCTYVGMRIRRRVIYLLLVIPISTILMQTTNDWHHFYYTSVSLRADAPFPVAKIEHGPYFYVYFVFTYSCFASGIMILLSQLGKVLMRFRLQILAMVAGILAPTVASFFYVGDMSPYGIDLGPVFMSCSFIFHAVALLRYQMFNAAPIARDKVFESMKEGVIVLSEDDKIVDFNNAVRGVIPQMSAELIGRPLAEALRDNEALAAVLAAGVECDAEHIQGRVTRHYHILFSTIINKNGTKMGRIVTFVDMTERVSMEQRLKYLASTDSLTRLFNKTAVFNRSEELLKGLPHSPYSFSFSVIMFDIDYFKQINDTYGHEAGDQALIHLSLIIRENLGDSALAGRYGGDEFIICMPHTEVSEAGELAECIRRKVAESSLSVGESRISMTSSFGIAHTAGLTGGSGEAMQQLVRQADDALYEAKRRGRNRVCVYEQRDKGVRPSRQP
ncbi:histidine kinase N-terminal 7TM domain-containing protein [Paenibacillus pinistramenti]|uniref:histidine kinase N-terminal 7TM domain-containing diguanylate cyclase n=1 Tax=Paenibacillus pinistramenti TaxID=1768003 RepID=UPI001107FF74|nr:histidine kinase N-terminal 7TM domain-containing protein [Paenibacillus pinistramenti]